MPSTYTLNNGIELIGTGEQSGTWGATTNTNFDLVDTALDGQVSIALAAAGNSGSPNNLPVSDGSASNGRNRMVMFTDGGDLGATAYVQLTPNDSEKIIYVRNSLSGSRSIIMFQGTYNASNDYEVPAGTTAVVYFDGAGAGAVAANVFNNAHFDALNVVGNVTVGGDVTVTGTVDAGTVEFDNLSGTGAVSVTNILDEDNMASDSATALSTQQSIKAYVDAQVGTVDTLAEILANGNTTGGTDIVVSVDDVISMDNGTNLLPSLTTTGDLNTGLYFPAADEVGLTVAGTQRLNVNATGVDITGTVTATGTSVFASLDISGDIDVDGTTNLDIVDIDGAVDMASTLAVAGDANFDSGTLFVDVSANNVGIGNATPAYKLAVGGVYQSVNTDLISITDTATIYRGTPDGTGYEHAKVFSGRDTSVATYGSYLSFYTENKDSGTTDTSVERFRIASDGSLSTPTLGTSNVRFGANAGNSIASGGNYNTVVGDNAGTAITTGDQNVALGYLSLRFNTTGAGNTASGYQALYSNTTGTYNTASGYNSLFSNTTGGSNVASGYQSLYSNTTGSNNVASGQDALYSNTTGTYNVASSYRSLYSNTTGAGNVASGRESLRSNTTGGNNVASGYNSLYSNTTASYNVASGYESLYYNTTGAGNVASGYSALYNNTTASYNVASGYQSLYTNTTGAGNVASGFQSLYSNTTASNNTAVGYQAGRSNTTGTHISAFGYQSLYYNTTGDSNVATGYRSLHLNTTGGSNVASGYESLYNNTTGGSNVASGFRSLYSNTTGGSNVASGYQSLYYNTTGGSNVASGYRSLHLNTTGSYNVASGYQSLYSNTTGASNTASGVEALFTNTTGAYNVASGRDALYSNTTGANNTASGYQSLFSNTTANYNTAVGYRAGYTSTTAERNTTVGYESGYYGTTGSYNTLLGMEAGFYVTTGSKNTIVGQYNGNQDGLDIRTSSNNIVLSDGDGNPWMWHGGSSQEGLEFMNSTAANKNVRFAIVQGDGGTSTAQTYWNIQFGTTSGCLGAWDRSGNFAAPATTITASHEWAIYGFIYEGA